MPARRSLPDHPSLRYLKVEAKERTRSGEFAALHEDLADGRISLEDFEIRQEELRAKMVIN